MGIMDDTDLIPEIIAECIGRELVCLDILPPEHDAPLQAALVARAARKAGTRPRVFCASLSDWLDNQVPVQWRAA